ncbi:MAG: MoaD/ThiS family protein [Thermoleophilia bacterium]
MPSVTVILPSALTAPEPPAEIVCDAASVGEALHLAVAHAPRYGQRIFYKDRLLVSVALNGRQLPPAEAKATVLAAGDRLDLMPPIAGG